MAFSPLPFRSSLADYDAQVDDLLRRWTAGESSAVQLVRHNHPRFLDERTLWLPKRMTDQDALRVPFDRDDARLAVARWYDFADWARLSEHVAAITTAGSPVEVFESAVEAVINGALEELNASLRSHPDLVRARSVRITSFDPPVHGATLLHYLGANGVENHRQKTPANAVAVARTLLDAGADVDALAGMYGGRVTTMSLLVSSTPPAQAGLQVALIETLLDAGAAVDGTGEGAWTSPLMTALAFGFRDAAEALARRGADTASLPAAAGLGRLEEAARLLGAANPEARHRALAIAAQLGHAAIVRLLLDEGEDPNRYNPPGLHAHATPLHQAISSGRDDVVCLLVERGARLDVRDTLFDATPLGWAEYGGQTAIAEYLRERTAG